MSRVVAALLFAAVAAVVAGSARPGASQPGASQPGAVPSQTAHYQPPVALSKADAARLDRVIELLESIERNTAPARAVKAGPDRPAVAKTRCAGCHTPAKADKAGGGFILFGDDKATTLKPLSARERTRVKEAVESGAMPPDRALTPAERSALTQ
ncbi:hypothetical protein J0H58_35120 [bacterium]|nr:hypothetical protein [bacterium]